MSRRQVVTATPTQKSAVVIIEEKKEIQKSEVPAQEAERSLVVAENKTNVANWKIALGVGLVAACATAGTIYYVRQKRQKELSRARYMDSEDDETAESLSEKANRYWGLTVQVFSSVRNIVGRYLVTENSPMVATIEAKDPFESRSYASEELVTDF